MLGGSKLNFAGGFSTRSHCSLQVPASFYPSTYLGLSRGLHLEGMAWVCQEGGLGEEKNFTEVADLLLSPGDLWCFITRVALLFLGTDKPVCAAGD